MLCIKEMNPLKKSNRGAAAVLGFRWNGEAPFWAEPAHCRWPGRLGSAISASPSVWDCLLWIPFPGLCSRFYKFRSSIPTLDFYKKKAVYDFRLKDPFHLIVQPALPPSMAAHPLYSVLRFLFCHIRTAPERAG